MGLRGTILLLLDVYGWLIIARALLSWFNPRPSHPLLVLLIRTTEPVLAPLRSILPFPGVDLSPVLAFVLIRILASLIA